jgi:hypothetical protein
VTDGGVDFRGSILVHLRIIQRWASLRALGGLLFGLELGIEALGWRLPSIYWWQIVHLTCDLQHLGNTPVLNTVEPLLRLLCGHRPPAKVSMAVPEDPVGIALLGLVAEDFVSIRVREPVAPCSERFYLEWRLIYIGLVNLVADDTCPLRANADPGLVRVLKLRDVESFVPLRMAKMTVGVGEVSLVLSVCDFSTHICFLILTN